MSRVGRGPQTDAAKDRGWPKCSEAVQAWRHVHLRVGCVHRMQQMSAVAHMQLLRRERRECGAAPSAVDLQTMRGATKSKRSNTRVRDIILSTSRGMLVMTTLASVCVMVRRSVAAMLLGGAAALGCHGAWTMWWEPRQAAMGK